MANDIKEIGDIVKKCKILLLDIEGTTTSISFVKDKLFPYAAENVKQFLDSQWETDDVKEAVAALRKLALEDQEKSVEGVVAIPGEEASKEEQIEGLVGNVKWQMSSDRKEGALKQLQGLIWKQGYDNGDIKGHVYEDVSAALEQWHSVEGQKVYIYSSGSVQAQKLLFGQSQAGDLLRFIDGHFDTAVGAKQDAASYTAIAEKIGVEPKDVLFLTDIPKEGEAARSAGFHVALVSREGNAPLSSEATEAFAVVHSLAQLTATNKRKTDPQDELPAKVPKTETDDNVKTASESLVPDANVPEKKINVEEEKMEVEESLASESLVPDVNVPEEKIEVKEEKMEVEESPASESLVPDVNVPEKKIKIEKEKVEVEESLATESLVPVVSEPEKKIEIKNEKVKVEESPASESLVNDPKQKINDKKEKVEVEESSSKDDAEKHIADSTVTSTVNIIEDDPIEVVVCEVDSHLFKMKKNKPDINEEPKDDMEEAETVQVITMSDELTKPDDITNVDGAKTKLNDELPKPEEVVTKLDIDTKPDEVSNKADEAAEAKVTPANEPNEIREAELVENNEAKINDEEQNEEPVESKEQKETPAVKEKEKVVEETPPTVIEEITEIEEITTENLSDVAEMIEDLEPIVEEPPNEDMEDLQNAGEVLEKECDEILSKVQDVTNLDSIPLKPLLNTITEEAMETELDTENMDSNDIVERILDTELELEMKQCNDIDPNIISEITDDAKMEESVDTKLAGENKIELTMNNITEDTENDKDVGSTPQSMGAESSQSESKLEDNTNDNDKIDSDDKQENIEEETTKVENNDVVIQNDKIESNDNDVSSEKEAIKETADTVESSDQNSEEMETHDTVEKKDVSETTDKVAITDKAESNDMSNEMTVEETQLPKSEESKVEPTESNKEDVSPQPESTAETASEETATDSEKDKESQVNGKETNGDAGTVNVNGDASNVEELNARLAVENGKEPVNGSNGDLVKSEKGQGDNMEAEVSDIKVKAVAPEESHPDPIDQPMEA